MNATVNAIYRNGVFVPEDACELPEGAEVRLTVEGPTVIPASVTDPEERRRIRKRIVERMRRHPLAADAPRFTREQLHERR
jgi:predicted DNA-binding antitoxin AbrB/MazE fold protein